MFEWDTAKAMKKPKNYGIKTETGQYKLTGYPAELTAYEWDANKAAANLAKHGVRFDVAARVFDDPWRMERDVTHEPDREVRHKVVGLVDGRLLAVVFTVRKGATRRIISARHTNTQEERQYADHS